MVHVWSINSGERFQGHHGPLVILSRSPSKVPLRVMGHMSLFNPLPDDKF